MTPVNPPPRFPNRRQVLRAAVGAAAVLPFAGDLASAEPASAAADDDAGARPRGRELIGPPALPTTRPDPWDGLKVGVASYSFRKLPLEATIKGIQRLALHYVVGEGLPPEARQHA